MASSSSSFLLESKFDISEIAEFDPLLITGFDAESSLLNHDPDSAKYLLHANHQVQDMFNAYLYAQNSVLPLFRKKGIYNVTPEELLTIIKKAHTHIAKTLAKDRREESARAKDGIKDERMAYAGIFSSVDIFRFHDGARLSNFIIQYLSKTIPHKLIVEFAKEQKIDLVALNEFIKIMEKIRDDKTIKIKDRQRKVIEYNTRQTIGQESLYKLANVIYANILNDEDKRAVDKIVSMACEPELIPDRMEQFAKDLLKKMTECKLNSIDEIAELAYFIFDKITEIHPFFNGNGRLATWMLNVMLRYFNLQSILIRNPLERNDPNSAYSRAIKEYKSNPTLMKNLIKNRIISLEPYKNAMLSKGTELRMKLGKHIENMMTEFPLDKIEEVFAPQCKFLQGQFMPLEEMFHSNEDPQDILDYYNQILTHFDQPLRESFDLYEMKCTARCIISYQMIWFLDDLQRKWKASSPLQKQAAKSSPSVEYNKDQRKQIINKLILLTEEKAWEMFKEKGSLAIKLKVQNLNHMEKLISDLNKTGAVNATSSGSDNKSLILRNIDLTKLLAFKKAEEIKSSSVAINSQNLIMQSSSAFNSTSSTLFTEQTQSVNQVHNKSITEIVSKNRL